MSTRVQMFSSASSHFKSQNDLHTFLCLYPDQNYSCVSRETIYGRMWSFTSDFSRGDTAYTKLALDRHTDTAYFQEPSGCVCKKKISI